MRADELVCWCGMTKDEAVRIAREFVEQEGCVESHRYDVVEVIDLGEEWTRRMRDGEDIPERVMRRWADYIVVHFEEPGFPERARRVRVHKRTGKAELIVAD